MSQKVPLTKKGQNYDHTSIDSFAKETISVFKNLKGEALYLTNYNALLANWPVKYSIVELDTSFAKTHVIVSGPEDAYPLVLLHGYNFSSTEWLNSIASLSRNYRTYAIDIAGQVGKSVLYQPIKTAANYTTWLKEVFEALGIEQGHLAGHSYGGWLALHFALKEPGKVSKLVLLAPGASFKPLVAGFFVRGMVCTFFSTRFVVKSLILRWMTARENRAWLDGEEALVEQFRLSFKYFRPPAIATPLVYSDEELKGLKMPVLLMLGEQEVIYNVPAVIARAGRLIPDIRIILVAGAGHGLNMELPELVTSTILQFLDPETTGEPKLTQLTVATV